MIPAGAELNWAVDRIADLQRREGPNSLLSVGPDKPLGQMGLPGQLWPALKWFWNHRTVIFRRRRGELNAIVDREMGWVYVWHRAGLRALLDAHADLLREQGWPVDDCAAFVQRTRDEPVPPLTPLYAVIAAAYGDTLNPGLSHVVPGADRAHLFEVFEDMFGFPDPAQIYFLLQEEVGP